MGESCDQSQNGTNHLLRELSDNRKLSGLHDGINLIWPPYAKWFALLWVDAGKVELDV